MRKFVMGDIHGGYRGLVQVLRDSNFDYENDTLICLGDLVDGWSESHLVIEELKKIKNIVLIKGNHDEWAMVGLVTGNTNKNSFNKNGIEISEDLLTKYNRNKFFMVNGEGRKWIDHGGIGTKFAYKGNEDLIEDHVRFLDSSVNYHIDDGNRFFSHSGPDPFESIEKCNPRRFYWNREFWSYVTSEKLDHKVLRSHLDRFNEIYIGHTPTVLSQGIKDSNGEVIDTKFPINVGNVWNMDTGSCFSGRLSMMNIETKEIFQSDRIKELYPTEKGRLMMCYNDEVKLGIEQI